MAVQPEARIIIEVIRCANAMLTFKCGGDVAVAAENGTNGWHSPGSQETDLAAYGLDRYPWAGQQLAGLMSTCDDDHRSGAEYFTVCVGYLPIALDTRQALSFASIESAQSHPRQSQMGVTNRDRPGPAALGKKPSSCGEGLTNLFGRRTRIEKADKIGRKSQSGDGFLLRFGLTRIPAYLHDAAA